MKNTILGENKANKKYGINISREMIKINENINTSKTLKYILHLVKLPNQLLFKNRFQNVE